MTNIIRFPKSDSPADGLPPLKLQARPMDRAGVGDILSNLVKVVPD